MSDRKRVKKNPRVHRKNKSIPIPPNLPKQNSRIFFWIFYSILTGMPVKRGSGVSSDLTVRQNFSARMDRCIQNKFSSFSQAYRVGFYICFKGNDDRLFKSRCKRGCNLIVLRTADTWHGLACWSANPEITLAWLIIKIAVT